MAWYFYSVLILVSNVATAYPIAVDVDGTLQRWDIGPNNPIVYYEVKTDMPAYQGFFRQFVQDSAALWSQVPGASIELKQADPGQVAQITINMDGKIQSNNHSAGYAIFDEHDGEKPSHCSVFIAAGEDVGYSDLSKTTLHEMGHCIGLGHSTIPESIMSYSLEKNSFALDVDDEAAVARLYPEDGSNASLPPGCAIGTPPKKTRGRYLAILLLPLAFLIKKRLDI